MEAQKNGAINPLKKNKLMTLAIKITMNSVIDLRSQYRPEIDGLRASALLAGIVNHFNSTLLPSGFLGIAIFFYLGLCYH
jgi:hypothetical protein